MAETPAPGTDYMLGQIDAKVTMLLANISRIDERMEKHDNRITKVERSQWKLAGMAAVIPTVLAILGIAVPQLAK